jgi:tRNA (cmo5U34)-methyltransferase
MTTGLTPEEFYDGLSPEYDAAILRCVPRYKEMLWAILRYIPDDLAPKRVLDLGVGSGNLSEVILERYPEAKVTGLDISKEMLAVARKRLPTDRLEPVQRDFRDLGFEDGAFDLVVSSISIHHIDDEAKQALFRDIHRVLRPGGVIAYSDQFRGATPETYAKHIARWREESFALGATEEEWTTWMTHQDDHDFHTPLADQMAWLADAGFTDLDCPWRFLLWTVLVGRKAG